MKNPSHRPANQPAATATANRVPGEAAWPRISPRARLYGCLGCLLLLAVIFLGPLLQLAEHTLHTEFDSYILLVPFISAYLLHLKASSLPRDYSSSVGWSAAFVALGLLAFAISWRLRREPEGDFLTFSIAAFLCGFVAVGFFFLGRRWMAQAAFPAAFLVFMLPLPGHLIAWLENCSKFASAEMAGLFFNLSNTPNLRSGLIFQLSDVTIEVAPECSGIRSSLVLFITSLLAAHLFLRSPWRQMLLVALVIPLGFVRNGFRIWTIGQLCVHFGPQMIDSIIHRRGGPVFFALSLLPVFLLIWWLRRGEKRRELGLASTVTGQVG